MTVIEDVVEIEYKKDDTIITTYRDHLKNKPGKSYDLDDVSINIRPGHKMPVMIKIEPDRTIFMPVEPLTCWINPHTGDTMNCDSKDEAKRNQWKEKDAKAFQKELDQDMTGQDRERWDAEHGG